MARLDLERDAKRLKRRELDAAARIVRQREKLVEDNAARELRLFRSHCAGAFARLVKGRKCKIDKANFRIEFSYDDKIYWLQAVKEWRTASNEGEADGYHLTYVVERVSFVSGEPKFYVCDFYNETTKNIPHKMGCKCGCLGWGLTVPNDQYTNILRALNGSSRRVQ